MRQPDRVDRRQVDDIEAQRGDLGQAAGGVGERAVLVRILAL